MRKGRARVPPPIRALLRTLYRAGLVCGLVYLATTLDGQALRGALGRVPPAALCAGAMCAFVNLFGKGTSWWVFLGSGARPSLWALWGVHLRAAASSIVMPLRAGEGLRIYWLRHQWGLPTAQLVAVALAEKLVNVATLLMLVVVSAAQEEVPLPWLSRASGVFAAGGAALVALLALLVVLRKRWGRAGAALHFVTERGLGPWLLACACAMVGWCGDCVLVWLMAHAVDVPLPLLSSALVLLAINVGIALPGTPGHVGTMELAAGAALTAYGATREAALSFALLYHSVQVIPVLMAAALNVLFRRCAQAATTRRATAARR